MKGWEMLDTSNSNLSYFTKSDSYHLLGMRGGGFWFFSPWLGLLQQPCPDPNHWIFCSYFLWASPGSDHEFWLMQLPPELSCLLLGSPHITLGPRNSLWPVLQETRSSQRSPWSNPDLRWNFCLQFLDSLGNSLVITAVVLLFLGCCNKIPKTDWLNRDLFSQSSAAFRPRSQQIQLPVRALSWLLDGQPHCVLT